METKQQIPQGIVIKPKVTGQGVVIKKDGSVSKPDKEKK